MSYRLVAAEWGLRDPYRSANATHFSKNKVWTFVRNVHGNMMNGNWMTVIHLKGFVSQLMCTCCEKEYGLICAHIA